MRPYAADADFYFIPEGSRTGSSIRDMKWAETPLGNPAEWPQSLRIALSIMLHSSSPMLLLWGSDFTLLMNDAADNLLQAAGKKVRIGQPGAEAFAGVWSLAKPVLEKVRDSRLPASNSIALFSGTHYSFAYIPVAAEPAQAAGVMVMPEVNRQQPGKVIGEIPREYLNDLMQAPVAMCIFRGEQHIVEVANQLMLDVWGKSAAEIMDKPVFEGLPEAKGQGLEQIIDEVFATGIQFSAHERPVYLPRNGSVELTYINFVYQPVRSTAGEITGIVAIASDVTQQVLAQRKIEQSEKRFREVADCAPVLIWMAGTDKLCNFFNKAWLDFTGRTMQQEYGNGWAESVHPDDYESCLSVYTSSFDTRKEFYREYRLRRYDGSYRWVSDNGVPRFTAEGIFEGYIGACMDIHEERSGKKQLQENEDRLNIVIESSGLAVWELDVETEEIIYGRRYMEIFGYDDDDIDLSHQELVAHFHPEDIKRRKKALERAFAKGKLNYQARIIWRDKSIHWIEVRGKVFYSNDGTPQKIIGTLRDITEDKYHEELLQEREAKFRLLADSMPQFVWTGDVEGNLNYFNQSVYSYSGFTPEQVAGEGWLQIIHPDERQENIRLWMQSVSSGCDFLFQHRFRRKDGVYRWQLSRAIAQRDEQGKIKMWVGTSTDIEDQKTQSIRLEQIIEERTKELLAANESLQKSNLENTLSKYNKRFLTEFSERFSASAPRVEFFNSLVQYISDLTGLDYVLIGELEEREGEVFVNTISLAAAGKLKHNITYSTKDGPCEKVITDEIYIYPEHCRQLFPHSETLQQFNVEGYIGYPLFDTDAKPIGLIAVMHQDKIEDWETVASILRIVAKRSEIEIARIKYEGQLEETNKTLAQANIHLDKMNKELESFAYISSHDLQEPLRKIQMFSTRILEKESDNLSENGRHYFGRIQSAVSRMQILIDDLLSYSRTSTTEKKFEKVNIGVIIEDVRNELKELIAEKSAVVEVGDMYDLMIIPFQFRQLMHNFFTNSLKFSRPGVPPHISIVSKIMDGRLYPAMLAQDKVYCYLSFSDNGIGFEPEYRERIFEVFQRLHGRDEYVGTGIGLAIVKKIVENHQGIILANGELNKGATFEIYIPVS
jgi:PAS domain S-box-containing protein